MQLTLVPDPDRLPILDERAKSLSKTVNAFPNAERQFVKHKPDLGIRVCTRRSDACQRIWVGGQHSSFGHLPERVRMGDVDECLSFRFGTAEEGGFGRVWRVRGEGEGVGVCRSIDTGGQRSGLQFYRVIVGFADLEFGWFRESIRKQVEVWALLPNAL